MLIGLEINWNFPPFPYIKDLPYLKYFRSTLYLKVFQQYQVFVNMSLFLKYFWSISKMWVLRFGSLQALSAFTTRIPKISWKMLIYLCIWLILLPCRKIVSDIQIHPFSSATPLLAFHQLWPIWFLNLFLSKVEPLSHIQGRGPYSDRTMGHKIPRVNTWNLWLPDHIASLSERICLHPFLCPTFIYILRIINL